MIDPLKWCSYDSETRLFRAGEMAPPIVCASTAKIVDDKFIGELLPNASASLALFQELLDSGLTIAFANAAYDLCVAAQARPDLLSAIFRALRERRVHDILIAEALNAVYGGHLNAMPDGSSLYNPETGEQTKRYSLPLVVLLTLGRSDAKANAAYKKAYALFEGVSAERWPAEAREYPKDDAVNTLEAALAQVVGCANHSWVTVPRIDGSGVVDICQHCGEEISFSANTLQCPKAPRVPHHNLDNLPEQVEADFALELGACWSLRTDPERVEKLAVKVEEQHRIAVERFQKKGWIRSDGTEDQAAVKRAIVVAYGASGQCEKCGGTGRYTPTVQVDCRGVKERGRYRGCLGAMCLVCGGTARVSKFGNEKTCKHEFDADDNLIEAGCDGTGFDLDTAPMLPRTKNKEHPRRIGGVSTDRDATMESGDDDLSDYGENEFEKSRTAYVPWLRTGTGAPLSYSPNVLVATGRCSYEGSPIHQMPRAGGERECIRARGAWCGSPVEYVLGSTDYEAGELCTHAQLNFWLFGYSQMRDAINASGKPGILHSVLAAEVLGISLEEFLVRLKAKDKQATDFRQMCKPINFGKGGGMGDAKLVLTSRKKNAGFTVAERGPAVNGKGQPGYWGVRFCLLTGGATECGTVKILEYKKRPCAPVCKACVDVVAGELNGAYFRRYAEMKDYFKWASKKIDEAKRNGSSVVLAPTALWDPRENAPRIVRERGIRIDEQGAYSALCNNGFQSMLSDIGKHAFVRATRECYLGVKDDGSSSPLAGCRLPLYLHDEPLSELIAETAHLSGPRIAEIMMESGRLFAPDVAWRAETALAKFWSKSMEPVYTPEGKLVLWEPEKKAA